MSLSPSKPAVEDAVFVYSLDCAFCFANLDMMSVPQREAHYEDHFKSMVIDETLPARDNHPPGPSKATPSSPSIKNKLKTIWPGPKETDDFWYTRLTTAPPTSCTPGLIPLIRRGLCKGHDRGNVKRAVLCYDQVVHIIREPWDAGWGCGYRNFLMACGALMSQEQQPLYFPLLDSPISPSVRNLQVWIEAAWREGFDKEGSKELKKLVNTSKWIGTADLWVAFIFRGIPAQLVNFHLTNYTGVDCLIKWVVDYFTPTQTIDKPTNIFEFLAKSPVTSTNKMPLILQNNGHSRIIVGYEVDGHGITNLLMFDPSHRPSPELRSKALAEFSRSLSSDSAIASSPAPSCLKRKRSADVQLYQKEESAMIREIGHPKSSNKEPSTKTTSPSKQGSSKNASKDGLDLYSMLKKFRLDPKNLSKKKQYQILYFPMTAPLTNRERMQRKEVTSIDIS